MAQKNPISAYCLSYKRKMPDKETDSSLIDIREDSLLELSQEVLESLLRDHTTGNNIFWATHDYEALGSEYDYHAPIFPHLITGERGMIIRPRVLKSKENQTERAKDKAEVFTPSWICNAQNNLVDEAWFGRKDVFNVEDTTSHTWQTNPDKIEFPEGRTWQDYVRATRMEITCGEAPYLASRYDTTTGVPIPLEQRIGLLDRKLRVVGENTETSGDWLDWAQVAYRHTYGYEWQGDNLLLAREALLWTFIEYYQEKFGERPLLESINDIADTISWNLWQMDGLKGVVPDSCHDVVSRNPVAQQLDLFAADIPEASAPQVTPCPGCQKDDIRSHNGTYCKIKDWDTGKEIKFISLLQ